MRIVLVGLTLLGACSYTPGSFVAPGHTFPGMHATAGCLDLAVERRRDHEGAAIVAYEFANRCDAPAIVDLAYARVTGRTARGDEVTLVPYDPNHELRSLRLDARSIGREALAYHAEGGEDAPILAVCVDLATVAHATGAKVLCLSAQPEVERDVGVDRDEPAPLVEPQ
ncbi:MAG: hypothetical protein NT062_31770 [Proteobacteria bacterium]|nr:hypothetical protein [Pseudomonadota bacterium]